VSIGILALVFRRIYAKSEKKSLFQSQIDDPLYKESQADNRTPVQFGLELENFNAGTQNVQFDEQYEMPMLTGASVSLSSLDSVGIRIDDLKKE